MPYARIVALGSYVPEQKLTNADLARMVDTSDEWIVRRTGIRERRLAARDQFTSDLCLEAVKNMTDKFPVSLDDVDLIIAATHTPDFPFPGVACRLQAKLGLSRAGAVDLNATCAGFPYALHLADGLIRSGLHHKILIVAGDTMSKITDYTDRTTCILFGDGAGAALVASSREPSFLGCHVGSDGDGGRYVYRSGLSRHMDGMPLHGDGRIVQNGREVYRWAVRTVPEGMAKLAHASGIPLHRVDWFIPHSANLRMIEAICEKSGLSVSKTLWSLEYFGNTSAASIPLALDLGLAEGKVKDGDLVLLYGFGGGLTHAGLLLRWLAG